MYRLVAIRIIYVLTYYSNMAYDKSVNYREKHEILIFI